MNGAGASPACEREEVIFFTDRETGLRGITVLDDVGFGPAVGACRSRPYVEEERALADAIRQARTTTAKASIAGLPVAGGCTVLLSSSPIGSRQASPMPALARAVQGLGGRYFLIPDLQGDLNDVDEAAPITDHLLGRTGQSELDIVEATAIGLRIGIETAVRRRLSRDDLMGVRVAIVGLGRVGYRLAELLRQQGARLTVADRDPRRTEHAVRSLGINCVATEEIVHLDNDVFVPCSGKDAIDDSMLSHLRCKILAGGVDDPLQSPVHGSALHERGILYAPDTVINAGGLISLVQPLQTSATIPILSALEAIGSRFDKMIDRAEDTNLPTATVAAHMAEEALAERVGEAERQAKAS